MKHGSKRCVSDTLGNREHQHQTYTLWERGNIREALLETLKGSLSPERQRQATQNAINVQNHTDDIRYGSFIHLACIISQFEIERYKTQYSMKHFFRSLESSRVQLLHDSKCMISNRCRDVTLPRTVRMVYL